MVLVVGVAFITGIAFRNPTIKVIEANRGTVFEATEDEIASVEAGEMTGQRRIWVGGTTMTIITVDTKFQPLLPIALRPDGEARPRRSRSAWGRRSGRRSSRASRPTPWSSSRPSPRCSSGSTTTPTRCSRTPTGT